MQIHLSLDGAGGLGQRLYEGLRRALLDGQVSVGERLPPSRVLAAELGVSRRLVVEAYERLVAEGFLGATPGRGTFVERVPPPLPREADRAGPGPGAHWRPPLAWGGRLAPGRHNFPGGVTDRALLPWAAWRRAMMAALREASRDIGFYGDPRGEASLRLAIARYLGYSRGLACDSDAVLITQGAQQGLDLLARVRVAPGDTVAVEEPGYPPARAVFEARGARVVPVPVDEQGLCVDALPPEASVVYVTPSHQFPLGMPLSLERRLALLAFARRHDALVVEDDYDGEFRFEGRPLDALKSLDREGRVAYLGSFSKVLHADLRLGYLVMPPGLAPALPGARAFSDGYPPLVTQRALARLMIDGDFARHLRRMQRLYTIRRRRLGEALAARPDLWTPLPQVAGIHVALRLAAPVPDLPARLAAAEIRANPLAPFHMGEAAHDGLLLGFGVIDGDAIDRGVAALAEAVAG
ncbi:PLP-dependent aminotransferase family protein [Alcanivorax marinus]|uniref:PLP-dependent aminotransferase family protein n=1 Tax=Alloalcanivorax marinus TaxID=1177169 RepID=A0A9Q3YPI4_9GAMM|nr:PLP-dependent aminotransferase family protein [Alloalcanivorax marinus]MCC4309901.1 PLP-dependent aminotransferase family protein [Alloalcanivorax marinus]